MYLGVSRTDEHDVNCEQSERHNILPITFYFYFYFIFVSVDTLSMRDSWYKFRFCMYLRYGSVCEKFLETYTPTIPYAAASKPEKHALTAAPLSAPLSDLAY